MHACMTTSVCVFPVECSPPPAAAPCSQSAAVFFCCSSLRWWEARDSWQVVVNECTHLARQSEQWLPGPANEPIRAALLRWLRVFPYSLMEHLRQPDEEHRKVGRGGQGAG
jgi:hypothetical protein